MFDLARLRLLRDLARQGTMTAVAEARGLSSSAVSQQLAVLEAEAKVRLLERVGRRVQLTPEGERLVAHAESILMAVEAAERDLRGPDAQATGVLEVACFATYAKAHLLPALTRIRCHDPEFRVIIHELEPMDAIDAVRNGRCHLAVTYEYSLVPRPENDGLVRQPLLEEPVLVALPEKWREDAGPINLERLAGEDWIVGSRQPDDRLLADRACAVAGFAPHITHAVDDYDLHIRMVSAGLGVGFVPESALRLSKFDAVIARAPGNVQLSRRLQALTRNELTASPSVRRLLSALTMGN